MQDIAKSRKGPNRMILGELSAVHLGTLAID
jgi:hypothetical protein